MHTVRNINNDYKSTTGSTKQRIAPTDYRNYEWLLKQWAVIGVAVKIRNRVNVLGLGVG